MPPFVSIIIPAKNEESNLRLILPTLFDAIREYGGKCEVILVDNGSTDRTRAIGAGFGCKVIRDGSCTISGLRNSGAAIATGDYIAFLDADCIVDSAWLRCCIERLEDPRIGLVGTRAVPDLTCCTWIEEGWYWLISGAKRPDFPRWIGSSNMVMRKSVFTESGGFPEHLATSEDVNLCNAIRERYLICLEKRICTIHLRESKTVRELFKREMWRGKSSIRQFLESKDRLSDGNSIALALLFAGTIPVLSAGFVYSHRMAVTAILVQLSLPVLMMVKKKAFVASPRHLLQMYGVAFVYILARFSALMGESVTLVATRRNK